jgi:hypothetical protein
MQFWHMFFVAGTATFAIPVVIHLIFRMRKKRVVFSSLRFIQQSVLKKSKKLKLRELLLLLLRCLACILLALAFARPFRPGTVLAGSDGKPQEDLVMVLDDSPSLMAQEGPSVRWASLLDRARKEVAGHPSGDRVALVLSSEPGRPEIELSSNFGAFTSPLTRERPSARRGDLAQALKTAIELLAASTQTLRRIVVYTDLQANQIERGAWAEAAQKAAAAGRGISVQIETPSGQQPAHVANLAVTDVRAKSDVWIEGRPVPFAVRIANFGDNDTSNLQVRLMIDGRPLATKMVGLNPHSSTEIELSAVLPRAGEVFGTVEIEAHDAFPDDDKRSFAIHLRDSLRALVIEENLREKDSFLDESYYLRMALDPKARGGDTPSGHADAGNYVQVQAMSISKVTADMYANADLIVVAGIQSMPEQALTLLENAVRDGHNLVLFVGRSDGRILETFYNGPFWKEGAGLLPARPGRIYEGNRLERKYHQIEMFKAEHTLFKPFVGEEEQYMRLPKYLRHFEANPADLKIAAPADPNNPKANERPAGQVLATFTGGSPMVMERSFGKGNVLMFNFAPRPEATDLVQRKVFVPLLHQAVRYFAGVGAVQKRNMIAGDNFDFADAGIAADTDVALDKPGTNKETLRLRGSDHPAADVLGVFTSKYKKGNFEERAFWAVNLDPRESDLVPDDLAAVRNVFAASPSDKDKVTQPGIDSPWDDDRKSQAPEWRYFLVAALACLLLEVLLRDFMR